MDADGAADNIFVERLWRSVKYEEVYFKDYASVPDLLLGLTAYFEFYNGERLHQALADRTPHFVYATGQGGEARIVDKFGENGSHHAIFRGAIDLWEIVTATALL